MRNSLVTIAALALSAAVGGAQRPDAIRLQLQPGSEISFTGTSSLHGFTCKTSTFDAQLSVDPQYAIRARGERDMLMSDFGIRPPTMMLGAVKTGDRIVVRFNLQAGPTQVGSRTAVTAAP